MEAAQLQSVNTTEEKEKTPFYHLLLAVKSPPGIVSLMNYSFFHISAFKILAGIFL